MIQPLTIQDNTHPLVLSLPNNSNKKAGQNYFVNETSTPRLEIGIPSITLCSNSKPPSVECKKKTETYNEFTLPNIEVLCMLYIFYTVSLAVSAIIIPHYVTVVGLFLCPFFTTTVLLHACASLSSRNIALGVGVAALYPIVIVLNSPSLCIFFLVLFNLFCTLVALTKKPSLWVLVLILSLIGAASIGIIVFQVYPRSVHGIHASVLCSCVLACTTVYILKPKTFKLQWGNNG